MADEKNEINGNDLENVAGGFEIQGGCKCSECGKSFGSQAALNWHIEQEHSSGYVK